MKLQLANYVLQFYYFKEGDKSQVFSQIWEKGNHSLFWDWPCGLDNRKLACVYIKWDGTRDEVKRLGMQHPNQFKFSTDDRDAEYSLFLNLSDPPPFSIEKLEFLPKFFGANGMTINDFASRFRNHVVGDKLVAGRDKGIKCDCFVGLFKTGERVSLQRMGANSDWKLDIDFADDAYRKKFISVQPTFR